MSDERDAHIAELCERLAALLRDPQPGLATWAMARVRVARELRQALAEALGGPAGKGRQGR